MGIIIPRRSFIAAAASLLAAPAIVKAENIMRINSRLISEPGLMLGPGNYLVLYRLDAPLAEIYTADHKYVGAVKSSFPIDGWYPRVSMRLCTTVRARLVSV